MRIKPQTAIVSVLAIFVIGIAATYAAGLWQTKASKTPSKIPTSKLENTQYADAYDPADIRGSYTFSDISRLYGIPLEDLSAAFGVDGGAAADFKCKDLESIYGGAQYEIGTASVKMFTAYYLGLPYPPAEETYLPDTAAEILNGKNNMTQEQRDYLAGHTVPKG